MARISAVPAREAGFRTKLAYFFVRKGMAKLAGRELEQALEPVQVFAHRPKLLAAYGKLEQVTAKLDRLPERLNHLAQLKAATMTSCGYCIDLGSQVARRAGLSDDELLALPRYGDSDLFSELDKLVLDYAVAASVTPVEVSDQLFAALRVHLDEPQMVELTHLVALENYRGRFNGAMGIGSAGFSEGMVCAAPIAAQVPAAA